MCFYRKVLFAASSESFGHPARLSAWALLFSFCINDLPGCLRSVLHHLFADDVQLFLSFPLQVVVETIKRINDDLISVYRWAIKSSFVLNSGKS